MTEFGNWLSVFPAPIRLICGRGLEQQSPQAYAFLRNVLETYFNLHVRYHTLVAGQILVATILRELLNAKVDVTLAYQYAWAIGHLVGFDFGVELDLASRLDPHAWVAEQAMQGFVCLLTAVAETGTLLVLLLEDIDFATNEDLEFIEKLVLAAHSLPLLIVATALPEFEQKRPSWFSWSHDPFSAYKAFELQPLSAINARHLVNAYLKSVTKLPLRLVDIIVVAASGSPFAIKEMVRFLARNNIIEGDPLPQSVHLGRLEGLRLPARFEDLLRLQLHDLPAEAQTVLKRAAVVGRLFGDAVVLQLGEADQIEIDYTQLQATLNDLEKRGFIVSSPKQTFLGVQDYFFRYDFWRQAACNLLETEMRYAYHVQCAYWLITTCPADKLTHLSPAIADHFKQAGQKDQALEWNGRY